MKWILSKIEVLTTQSTPTLSLTWDNGISRITEYHPWSTYPAMPEWERLKPGIMRTNRGPAFFKAAAGVPLQDIYNHNLKHYIPSTQASQEAVIEQLEKATEEINEASEHGYLYWPSRK